MTASPAGRPCTRSSLARRTLLFGNFLDFPGWPATLCPPPFFLEPASTTPIQTCEAILIPPICYSDVTIRFRCGANPSDHRAPQNLGDFISIEWSRQHVSGTLGARIAQYSRLRRADACARICASWRMYQLSVERSTPIVEILVWRVLSTTGVLSTTASQSRTGDICLCRGQSFALRVDCA